MAERVLNPKLGELAPAESGGERSLLQRSGKKLLSVVLVAASFYLMRRAFSSVGSEALVTVWRAIPPKPKIAALILTGVSYLVLTFFDYFALKHFELRLPLRKVMVTSFISYAFNFNFGTLIGALALRYRLYAKLGLSPGDVTRVTFYATSASAVGYGFVAGVVHTWTGLDAPAASGLPTASLRPIGIAVFLASAAYLVFCHLRHTPLRVGRWRYELPDLHGAGRQIVVACAQWLLASLVLFALMPPGVVDFPTVLAIHLVAAVAGVITHVPAGYGVLEGTFLVMLAGRMSPPQILGTLVAFRVFYDLLPLAVAVVTLVAVEHRHDRGAAYG
jgi:uncharacterized membrane protein YbhN (UPF0104 family)